jgi:YD repeat-containing protein
MPSTKSCLSRLRRALLPGWRAGAFGLGIAVLALLSGPASNAATVTYTYYANGQLYQAKYDNGTVVTYTYDANGNRTGAIVSAPSLPAPSGLSATASSPTQINLAWSASTGATGYNIDRCQGSGCTSFIQVNSTTGTSYTDAALSPSTTYVYEVQAYDSSNNASPFSNTASAETQADTTPPTTPANLTAAAAGGVVSLSWSASTDNVRVGGYDIERCQGSGCTSFAQIATSTGASYSDSGAAQDVTYEYRVRAFDEAGNDSGYSNTASATLPDTTPPSVPAGLSASAVSWSTVSLSWSASTDNVGVAGYKVYRNGSQIGTTASPSYTDRTTSPSAGYSYTVSAYDGAGNTSAQSDAAAVTTPAEPAPAAPTGLTGSPASNSQVNLSWNPASDSGGPGIAGYRVYRNGSQIATTSSTSFSDTGVSAFNTYTYTVAAYDSFGETSTQSSGISVSVFYQITNSSGNVLSSAASLYTSMNENLGGGGAPQAGYGWIVQQAYGSKTTVAVVRSVEGEPACAYSDATVETLASGYDLYGCVLEAAPATYGH